MIPQSYKVGYIAGLRRGMEVALHYGYEKEQSGQPAMAKAAGSIAYTLKLQKAKAERESGVQP